MRIFFVILQANFIFRSQTTQQKNQKRYSITRMRKSLLTLFAAILCAANLWANPIVSGAFIGCSSTWGGSEIMYETDDEGVYKMEKDVRFYTHGWAPTYEFQVYDPSSSTDYPSDQYIFGVPLDQLICSIIRQLHKNALCARSSDQELLHIIVSFCVLRRKGTTFFDMCK